MSRDYGRQGPFGRALDEAISRDAERRRRVTLLCGSLPDAIPRVPCGLARGHVDRAGTPHRNYLGRKWTDAPTPPDGT